ncbi:MAG: FG-GAP repeat domain-containing protein, partial [Nostoc sp.]
MISGDFNNDNKLDLAVANNGDNTVSVLLGNGNGLFQTPMNYTVGSGPQSVISGDFNNDNKLDLAVANSRDNTVSVLLGNGNGLFQTPM